MNWINRLFQKKEKINLPIFNVRLMLPDIELTKYQKTDVLLNFVNVPFATLTESKLSNVWYFDHIENDYLFTLTANGFKLTKFTNKKTLFKYGFKR